jgi:hypothetical protein
MTQGSNPDEPGTTPPLRFLENMWCKHHGLKRAPFMYLTISFLP